MTEQQLESTIEKLVRSKIEPNAYLKASDVIKMLKEVLIPLVKKQVDL